jgi:hypothetical protein
MKELSQAIANSSIEQQVFLLPQALDYGDLGINFLIDRPSDSELEIRAKAYELIEDVESEKAQKAIAIITKGNYYSLLITNKLLRCL